MTKDVATPVDTEFFETAEARGLVNIQPKFAGGSDYYHPKDGQTPLGPVTSASGFVLRHFSKSSAQTAFLCDPGTDDFLTGLLAFDERSSLKPYVVVASFGNVGGAVTYDNAFTMVSLTKAFKVAVAKGSQTPFYTQEMPEDAAGEHGVDGLGGAVPINEGEVESNKSKINTHVDGVRFLVDDLINRHEKHGAPITILNTGSMTDLAHVLVQLSTLEPLAIQKIRGVSIMGGGIDTNQWHTNVTDWTEFNIFQDPDAAKIAFDLIKQFQIPSVVCPLDLTHQTGVRETHEGAWLKASAQSTGNVAADMAAQLFKAGGFDIERSRDIFKFAEDDITRFMHDPNTVTVLDHPELYGGFYADVDIITEGEKAGQTVVKSSAHPTPIFMVVQANAPGIIRNWQERLSTFRLDADLA